MKKYLIIIYNFLKKNYEKLMKLPKSIRYILGGFLIIVWALNIINPFVNWVILILIWARLVSEELYQKIKKKVKKSKKE